VFPVMTLYSVITVHHPYPGTPHSVFRVEVLSSFEHGAGTFL